MVRQCGGGNGEGGVLHRYCKAGWTLFKFLSIDKAQIFFFFFSLFLCSSFLFSYVLLRFVFFFFYYFNY